MGCACWYRLFSSPRCGVGPSPFLPQCLPAPRSYLPPYHNAGVYITSAKSRNHYSLLAYANAPRYRRLLWTPQHHRLSAPHIISFSLFSSLSTCTSSPWRTHHFLCATLLHTYYHPLPCTTCTFASLYATCTTHTTQCILYTHLPSTTCPAPTSPPFLALPTYHYATFLLVYQDLSPTASPLPHHPTPPPPRFWFIRLLVSFL